MRQRRSCRLFISAAIVFLAVLAATFYLGHLAGDGPLLPPPVLPELDAFVPAFYDLQLSLEPEIATLHGVSRVAYTNNEDVSLGELYFHLYPNAEIFSAAAERPGRLTVQGVRLDERPLSFSTAGTLLKIPLPVNLAPGEKAALELTWDLVIPDYPGRLGEKDGVISLGNWYPILAVYDEEGWHLDPYIERGDPFYSDVGCYRVRLRLPDAYRAAATGNLRSARDLPGPSKEMAWESGIVRDFALALSPHYRTLTDKTGPVLVQSYFPADKKEGGRVALNAGCAALEFFSQTFGPYPYDQFTLAATGFYQGGMEYPNIVFLSQQFYGPEDAETLEYVAVHETAHQWWYGVVGNNQVVEAWLDEGLTEFSTLLFYEKERGGGRGQTSAVLSLYEAYRQANGDGAILQRLDEFPSELAYNALVYGKGCMLFLALREKLGEDVLLKVLREYYQRYAYRTATTADFIRVAQEVSSLELAGFFQHWLHNGDNTQRRSAS
ncbi:MAG: M1 family metallopeptidase [bacterium]